MSNVRTWLKFPGILIYVSLKVYKFLAKFPWEDKLFPTTALPLFSIGTVLLCAGMFCCSFIIQRTTKETYSKTQVKHPEAAVYWIQPYQTVGDQVFHAWAESRKATNCRELYVRSVRKANSDQTALLWASFFMTLLGFIVQFLG